MLFTSSSTSAGNTGRCPIAAATMPSLSTPIILPGQLPPVKRLADARAYLVVLPWFGQKFVNRTLIDGAGDHDERQIQPVFLQNAQRPGSAKTGHCVIGDDNIPLAIYRIPMNLLHNQS